MTVSINAAADGSGLVIEDRIEQRQCRLRTAAPVAPTATTASAFAYPLDAAVTVATRRLTVGEAPTVYLRDGDGDILAELEQFSERSFPAGEYVFEVSGPVKLYLAVEGPLTVSLDAVRLTVELPEESELLVGARSYHEHPAATVRTTAEPRDLMRAVSALPSSLKTLSPERSFPTLRGHPPELAVGDELSIPDALTTPDSGIHIEVPPSLGPIFVAAPLAFYLGADVRPGSTPRLVTDTGYVHDLDHRYGFEREVERVLKQTFFLDCLARTEGIYDVPLYEREVVESRLDIDFAALYDAAPADRLERYLAVPFDALSAYVPRWKLTAHVTPDADSVDALPFLVDDLAVVRTPVEREAVANESQLAAIEEFTRTEPVRGGGTGTVRGPRASDRAHDDGAWAPSVIEPEETDSIEQAWVGPGAPVGASKALTEAFRNRLERGETTGELEIVVVCNDTEMLDEHETARDVYGSREELPFEVTFYEDLTTERLAFVLESEVDYFHYIGHIEREGFSCRDGMLDVRTLDAVAMDTFFLNACTSYQQGMALIEKGAIGGVVTLDEVINSGAIRVGKAMTRLLNRGFPIRSALTIAAERSIIGNQYIVIGDGNMDIAHAESLVPNLADIDRLPDGRFDVGVEMYFSAHFGIGSMSRPLIGENRSYYLVGSTLPEFTVTRETLQEFLSLETVPIRLDDRIVWSDGVDLGD